MRVKCLNPIRMLESYGDCQEMIDIVQEKSINQEVSKELVAVTRLLAPKTPLTPEVAPSFNEVTNCTGYIIDEAEVSAPSIVAKIEEYEKESSCPNEQQIAESLDSEGITINPPSIPTVYHDLHRMDSEPASDRQIITFSLPNARLQILSSPTGPTDFKLPISTFSGLLGGPNVDLSLLTRNLSVLRNLNVPSSASRSDTPETPKRFRIALDKNHREMFEAAYSQCPLPSRTTRKLLALKTKLPEPKIRNWFSYRRAVDRKKGLKPGIKPVNTDETDVYSCEVKGESTGVESASFIVVDS